MARHVGGVPRPIGWDTAQRDLESNYERLQHRRDEDLPPLPPALVRGTPESVLSPVAVQPVEVLPDSSPTPAEQTADLVVDLREAAVYPDPPATVREEWRRQQPWSADEAINPDGLAEALERWKRGERD